MYIVMQKLSVFLFRHSAKSMFFGVMACVLAACSHSDDPVPDRVDRTVLIYMAADNSLNAHWSKNVDQLVAGAAGNALNGGNLLVYVDPKNGTPRLLQVVRGDGGAMVTKTVREYEEHNSASIGVLRDVINYVTGHYPAESYGLGLWSHGTAWLPENAGIMMRSFGDDNGAVMDINELRDALPGGLFDFIFFDACYMASVEVAYALKDKARLIMASQTEVMGTGFPYNAMVSYFFKPEPELDKAAAAFFNYYDAQTGYNRTATVSVVATGGLPALAEAVKSILRANDGWQTARPSLLSEVQPSDYLYSQRALYDLKDFIDKLAPSSADAFGKVFGQAVLFSRRTPTCFFIKPLASKSTENVHGLSMYVTGRYPTLDDWYKRLDWYKAVYE